MSGAFRVETPADLIRVIAMAEAQRACGFA
jgi:hypothetical protein